jgi:hypothetical protein
VRECFGEIREIYESQGLSGRTRLLVGPGGHQFYPELAWPAFKEITGW